MNIQTATNTSIAAIQWVGDQGIHIRVYCQGEKGSRAISSFNATKYVCQNWAQMLSRNSVTTAIGIEGCHDPVPG